MAFSRKISARTNSWRSYSDTSYGAFEGVRVFGRGAGVDLIETNIGAIFQEAIRAAEAKRTSIALSPGKVGTDAFAGMVETLGTMTGLRTSEGNGVITVAWAGDAPSLY